MYCLLFVLQGHLDWLGFLIEAYSTAVLPTIFDKLMLPCILPTIYPAIHLHCLLFVLQGHLDWLAFSVDASSDDLHAAMGRGLPPELGPAKAAGAATAGTEGAAAAAAGAAAGSRPAGHLSRVLPLWRMARELGFRLKLNTVVTRVNL